jgi:ADP-ribose pyrophosphatase YjhB (NUDIX family)
MRENIGRAAKNASAIIIYHKNRVFINLRSKNKKIFYPNHWGCFGGAKNINESYHKAALRELYEETQITTNINNLKFFFNLDFTTPLSHKKIQRNFYLLEIKNIKIFNKNFHLSEGVKAKFFTKTAFLKIKKFVPYDKFAIDLFFRYKLRN